MSCAVAFLVPWCAEPFGFLFSDTASPLAAAPGAILPYAIIIGLLVRPTERPGVLLGVRREDDMGGLACSSWRGCGCWLLTAPPTRRQPRSAPPPQARTGSPARSTASRAQPPAMAADGDCPRLLVICGRCASRSTGTQRAFLAVAVIPESGVLGARTGPGRNPHRLWHRPDAGPLFILFAAGLYSLLPALEPAARLAPRPAYGG